MGKSNLHEEYNMKMAAISILLSVINDVERKITTLQNESNEIMDKISKKSIINNFSEECPKCHSKDIYDINPIDTMCNDCGETWIV